MLRLFKKVQTSFDFKIKRVLVWYVFFLFPGALASERGPISLLFGTIDSSSQPNAAHYEKEPYGVTEISAQVKNQARIIIILVIIILLLLMSM
jgi:hypothetical protein